MACCVACDSEYIHLLSAAVRALRWPNLNQIVPSFFLGRQVFDEAMTGIVVKANKSFLYLGQAGSEMVLGESLRVIDLLIKASVIDNVPFSDAIIIG